MKDKLEQLEALSRRLEPETSERVSQRESVLRYTEEFLNLLQEKPAYRQPPEHDPFDALTIDEEPEAMDAALELFREHVEEVGLNAASAAHLGYLPGGGIYLSALGGFLAEVTNRYSGIAATGPGAVRMENHLIRWMADLVGYPAGAAGNISSGGSIASLVAIVAARDVHRIEETGRERAVVYMSEQTHHCIHKALRVAGLGSCVVRTIPIDERYRARPDALERMIGEDRGHDLRPWMVIGNAGTTDTGAVDPLKKIGGIARRHRMWFHVDGAYGAFFALTDEGRTKLEGIEQSDSVVLDPHKGLFLPYGSGAVIVREARHLVDSHYYTAQYIQNDLLPELSPADLSPELTRPFRALRLWLPLRVHGLAPFRACLEEKLLLARYFHREIAATPGFEVGPEPDLSVVVFRYVPPDGDADAFNKALAEKIKEDGRVFLSYTTIDDRVMLRMAALSFRTHRDTIDLFLELLKRKSRELLAG